MKHDSKTKLIKAAAKEFAKNHYTGASTRAIAKKANLNISAITYYFGGKKGLYEAVLHEVANQLVDPFDDLVYRYNNIDQSNECGVILLKEFLAKFMNLFSDEDVNRCFKEIYFCEYFRPSDSFYILYDRALLPFYDILSSLLLRESKIKIKKTEANMYIFPFMAQIIVFGARKAPLCKLLGWNEVGPKEKNVFLKSIYNQIDCIVCAQ